MSPAVRRRFEQIFHLLQNDPYSNAFGGETLKYGVDEFRSFELTKKDRIVIQVLEEEHTVIIILSRTLSRYLTAKISSLFFMLHLSTYNRNNK
ncbi:MAG: hypothetical protein NC229_07985 [Bacteroides sp.]|nr:hypothetical protein [Bacteroides sp.]MCM1443480.1 hypothetical protein [Muribaculum sp.]